MHRGRSRERSAASPNTRTAARRPSHSPDDPLIVSLLTCVIYCIPIVIALALWFMLGQTPQPQQAATLQHTVTATLPQPQQHNTAAG